MNHENKSSAQEDLITQSNVFFTVCHKNEFSQLCQPVQNLMHFNRQHATFQVITKMQCCFQHAWFNKVPACASWKPRQLTWEKKRPITQVSQPKATVTNTPPSFTEMYKTTQNKKRKCSDDCSSGAKWKKKSFCLLSTHQSKKYTEPSLFNVCKNHKPLARSSRNHLARHSERGEEDKEDRGRGGKTTSGNGQAWSSPSPRGQGRPGKKNGGNWL